MTITISGMLPLWMVLPVCVILLETTTAIYAGTALGGGGLLPVELIQLPPQTGGVALRVLAKPLNALGAGPPERLLTLYHCDPHHVTVAPSVALLSPTTKDPTVRYWYGIGVLVGVAVGPAGVGVGVAVAAIGVRVGVLVGGTGVRVGVGVLVSVGVGVLVGGTGVFVGVLVGVSVGVLVAVGGTGVSVDVDVGVSVGVAVSVSVGVAVSVSVAVGVAVSVGVGVVVSVAVGVSVGAGVLVGVGVGTAPASTISVALAEPLAAPSAEVAVPVMVNVPAALATTVSWMAEAMCAGISRRLTSGVAVSPPGAELVVKS